MQRAWRFPRSSDTPWSAGSHARRNPRVRTTAYERRPQAPETRKDLFILMADQPARQVDEPRRNSQSPVSVPRRADRDTHPGEFTRIDMHDPLGTVSGDRTISYPLEPVGPEFVLDAWRPGELDAAVHEAGYPGEFTRINGVQARCEPSARALTGYPIAGRIGYENGYCRPIDSVRWERCIRPKLL
jgi:hypothetical protein